MKNARGSFLPIVATAAVGVGPAVVAAALAPGLWTSIAAAGALVATTSLITTGIHRARAIEELEGRERKLRGEASASDVRIAILEAKLRETATHDEVTGVLNRRTFLARLDEVVHRDARLQQPMALLLIDIDGFRKLNGDEGRLFGDRVLRTVGRAIQASTRGTDVIGRVGGDEFAVLLAECEDSRPAVDRLFVALHAEATGGEGTSMIRVSVGAVSIAEPHRGVAAVELFRLAEEALDAVRGSGGDACGTREYGAARPRAAVTT